MTTTRRNFIKNSALTVAGAACWPGALLKDVHTNKEKALGIQLYTVKEDMQKDPVGTLKQLKSFGYTHVEHAGYENRKFYGYSPEEFKKILHDNGLIMASGHSFLGSEQWNKAANDFTDEWKYTFEDAAKVGMRYVISPGVDESLCKNMGDFRHYMDLFNKSGELAKKNGVTFAYHNESYEFNHKLNNTVLYDLLLRSTDKNLVAQQIDIGNMYATGGRAMDFLKRYPGRFALMHVKDEIKSNTHEGGYESTILGQGVVHVKEAVDYARKTGTQYFIIEQEAFQNKTSMQCAREDLAVMKKWGY